MLVGLLVTAVVLNSLILLGVVIAAAVVIRRIDSAARAAEAALEEIRQELAPTLRAAQGAFRGVEALADRSEQELGRVDDVLRSVDRLISGKAVAETVVKAVGGSRVTFASILAGITEGLRVLRTPRDDTTKEGL